MFAGAIDDIRSHGCNAYCTAPFAVCRSWRARNNMSFTTDNMTRSALPMLDMMLQMQRIGIKAMSLYQPVASAFLDAAKASERTTNPRAFGTVHDRGSETRVSHEANAEQVVA